MTMTLDNPRYQEFIEHLAGPDGINLRDEGGKVQWECAHGADKSNAERILRDMGYGDDEIRSSIAYFEARGGFCDCEIVLNVGHTAADESIRDTSIPEEGA